MELDPLILSRVQFAFVIVFHIIFPAFTVGLASYIAMLETLYFFKRDEVYLRLSQFWLKMFAVSFGMGVVSGIVMPFQFGTNWALFSQKVANVVGPLLAYESLMAFFLEAGFLGVLLFGRKLVPQWVHTGAAILVAAGTLFSSFWILAFNSWMQTPAGYTIVDGKFMPEDWIKVIFNPSFPFRLAHTVTAFYITTAMVVLGVAAYWLRKRRNVPEAKRMMVMALPFLMIFVPLQIFLGDAHGVNTLHHQPTKIAALEGLWETRARAPAVLFAIPDQKAETNRAEISIPAIGSLYLTHDINGVVQGLKAVPPQDRPPVLPVFFAFRAMVGLGILMLIVVTWGTVQLWRGRIERSRWFLRVANAMMPAGFIAIVAGWIVTEVGRQPWTVYGLVRTSESLTPSLTGANVVSSLLAYIAVYAIVYTAGGYYLWRLVKAGPVNLIEPADSSAERPARPLSGAAIPIEERGHAN
ncbi:MAG: cytochrome ubiquinol oxidase subunit I [Burkholderiaceae bacterium]